MRQLKVAVIEGDGIGPEVTQQAVRVLTQVMEDSGKDLELSSFNLGAERYLADGHVLDETDLEELAKFDAILLGAVGDPRVPAGLLERGLLLRLRFDFDQYVNLRPAKHYPGVPSPLADPEGVDFVVVREGTEGLYVGNGGALRVGTPHEIATEVSVNTAFAVRRLVQFAFDLAQNRERKKLLLVHKANVLVHAGSLWQRTVDEVAKDYPEVEVSYSHVDAATIHMLTDPQAFDVIVTDNLFGDILTDEAAAVTGGIGLAASGNINPTGKYPSMFEPVHGSAPDIAGTGVADPIAAISSVALLLESTGYPAQAQAVSSAVTDVMRFRAENQPLEQTTKQVGDQVLSHLG